jgi:hypothetical protein
VIAAVRRLAHAELAHHALVTARRDLAAPHAAVTQRRDGLPTAFGTTMSRVAVSLRTLQPPAAIPALRPPHAGLRDERQLDATLLGVTDGLVDALDTIDAVLREHFGSPGATRKRRPGPPSSNQQACGGV